MAARFRTDFSLAPRCITGVGSTFLGASLALLGELVSPVSRALARFKVELLLIWALGHPHQGAKHSAAQGLLRLLVAGPQQVQGALAVARLPLPLRLPRKVR